MNAANVMTISPKAGAVNKVHLTRNVSSADMTNNSFGEALANAGLAQSAATQHGIGICFILAPAILSALLLVVAVLFPMTSEEFDAVQREVARRKGEDTSKTTDEEKKMLESVTGFSYDKLWSKDNAGVKKGEPELV